MNEKKTEQTPPDLAGKGEIPLLYAKGFCMGAADVVPGVSGGTMALILGIYMRLLDAIRSFDTNLCRQLLRGNFRSALGLAHWRFLAVLLAGIFSAVIFFTRVVRLPQLMQTHPEPVYGLFFGLILGSIWFVFRDSGIRGPLPALWVLAGTWLGFWVVNLVPTDTPEHPAFIFLSGAVAITAMILPGISGSFILLIMRKYEYIFSQFGRLGGAETLDAVAVLAPFALGIILGIAAFARVLSWLLHHYHTPTYLTLAGFMIGSLWVIWPWQERVYQIVRDKQRLISSQPILPESGGAAFWWGLGMMLAGLILVIVLEILGRRKKHEAGGAA